MTNEDKILSMLDVIAEQVTKLTEISATKDDVQSVKDELRSFKEQTNDRFNKIDERFDKFEAEPSAAHEAILAKIDDQSELLEARFDVLNDRLFTQETQLKLLKKKEAL